MCGKTAFEIYNTTICVSNMLLRCLITKALEWLSRIFIHFHVGDHPRMLISYLSLLHFFHSLLWYPFITLHFPSITFSYFASIRKLLLLGAMRHSSAIWSGQHAERCFWKHRMKDWSSHGRSLSVTHKYSLFFPVIWLIY